MTKSFNSMSNNRLGMLQRAGLVAGGVALAITGCSVAPSAGPSSPTVATAPATDRPTAAPTMMETTPTPTSTVEKIMNPLEYTKSIEIGADVAGNYLKQVEIIDRLVPESLLLAGEVPSGAKATLSLSPDYKTSYDLEIVRQNDGARMEITRRPTGNIITADRSKQGVNSYSFQKISEVIKIDLGKGKDKVVIISSGGDTDSLHNSAAWKTYWETDTMPKIKELVNKVSKYNPGGVNRLGETVEPDAPIYTKTGPLLQKNFLRYASDECPTIILATHGGNTVGLKISNGPIADSTSKDPTISNLSPAQIQALAKEHGVAVSFANEKAYPTDDVALYNIIKESLSQLG